VPRRARHALSGELSALQGISLTGHAGATIPFGDQDCPGIVDMRFHIISSGEFGYSGAFPASTVSRELRSMPGLRRAVDHQNSVRLVRPMIESTMLPACVMARTSEPAFMQSFTAPRRVPERSSSCPIRP
jgi:hypothetical protein